jgi:Protein of unknown function (DUF2934)
MDWPFRALSAFDGDAFSETAEPPACSEDERLRLIAEAAYYRAQRRGFEPGHEEEDWLLAEREVDEALRCAPSIGADESDAGAEA